MFVITVFTIIAKTKWKFSNFVTPRKPTLVMTTTYKSYVKMATPLYVYCT